VSSPAPPGVERIPGKSQYHGPPCARHGTTERFISNRACVACTNSRTENRPRYGLTPEQVALLLAAQSGRCAICKSDKPRHKHGWFVDHDHSTGIARGVLCGACNSGIGFFYDSVESLRNAIDYLTGDEQAARLFFVRESEVLAGGASPRPRRRRCKNT
jgi:hypothetical protein